MKQKLQLLTGYVEIFLICGLVYSWAVFDHILRKEGVYEELCETTSGGNETCPAQDKIFLQVTSAGSLMVSVGGLMYGLVIDRFEIRVTRILCALCLTSSFIIYYFLDLSSHLVWPFWILLSSSTLAPLLTTFKLTNNFPKHQMTLLTIGDGIFDTSVAATALWTYFYNNGMSVNFMAMVLIGFMAFFWLNTFLLLPKKNPKLKEENEQDEIHEEEMFLEENEPKTPSGLKYFTSKLSIFTNLSTIMFIVSYVIIDTRLVLTFYVVPTILENTFEDEEEKLAAGQFFTKANSLSFVVCWMGGALADRFHRRKTINFLLIFIILIQVGVSILPLFATSWAIKFMSIIFPIGRTMFYGISSMILMDRYREDFGFMFGVVNLTAAFVIFFMTNYIASNTEFLDQIMLVLGICCGLTVFYPLYELKQIWRESDEKTKKLESVKN
ncbi:Oidioi.mRNA.OKI2018_I69.chr2.g5415.t1.cds [Oikopleura dioica]|uniref:Oidioi.mRNA.OKI2018_I69.chr2.g5415.t1.cds n=1 Tax=Oikopleura dioica TaxID=34765 RepID=A0ABN7T4N1_OIKDI|nr:Oidioi.mRNA.OKI2018_I69.chr2.g5415.t1.cds [Oikopleura dioica]